MDFATLASKAQRTPAEIKLALPIAFVMEKAGCPVVEVDPDGRLHCQCPFHTDSAPSFDIFGRRWGCYPCGVGGMSWTCWGVSGSSPGAPTPSAG